METVKYTTREVRPCCLDLTNSLRLGYIRKGYLWHSVHDVVWIPWRFDVVSKWWADVSPIHYCPFCGTSLDERE
jgi:hypothetical protein